MFKFPWTKRKEEKKAAILAVPQPLYNYPNASSFSIPPSRIVESTPSPDFFNSILLAQLLVSSNSNRPFESVASTPVIESKPVEIPVEAKTEPDTGWTASSSDSSWSASDSSFSSDSGSSFSSSSGSDY